MPGYRDDLAYIHDAGFSDYARNAAPGLLAILRKRGIADGLVVDLGCGSGRWASVLNGHGYRVLGIDQSAAMIRLARRIAPRSEFRVTSLLRAKLPACDTITSIGECLNYCFDPGNRRATIVALFRRVYRALRPGGVFIFDIAEPSRIPAKPEQKWMEGRDWAIGVRIEGDRTKDTLRREIVSFRKIGRLYRRSDEVHELRLYRAADLQSDLNRCGFEARILTGYGKFRFPAGIAGIVAVKSVTASRSLRSSISRI